MLPNIYVLMRYYCPNEADSTLDQQLDNSIRSVAEAKKNYSGNVYLIVNDDSPFLGAYNRLTPVLLKYGFNTNEGPSKDCWLEKTNSQSSAYATFHIRQRFLEITDGDPSAVAITLDQDDCLKPGAISDIGEEMDRSGAGIVISPFEILDDQSLDITDDAGHRHNTLVRKISKNRFLRWRIARRQHFIPSARYESIEWPKNFLGFGESVRHLWNNFSLCCIRQIRQMRSIWTSTSNYYDLSSLGWTKSYRRAILEKYHTDLKEFLMRERGCNENGLPFFANHPAYEDFIDFYPLLLNGCKISAVRSSTHIYKKHAQSITSTPKIEDFLNHRTASLIALIDLCYFNRESLQQNDSDTNFEYKLLRFISKKVSQIEYILQKYRDDFYNGGEERLEDFADQTYDGYFISKLCRLASGDKSAGDRDNDLFRFDTARGVNSKTNIEALFSTGHLNSIPPYHLKLTPAPLRSRIREAVECEKKLTKSESVNPSEEEEINRLMDTVNTPQQKRYKTIKFELGLWWVLGLIGITVFCADIFKDRLFFTDVNITAVSVIASLWIGVLSFLLYEHSRIKVLAIEENSLKKLYYSEFMDFIRHIEANLKVMIQIRKNLKGFRTQMKVEDIHFKNLIWPENSCLFSDEISKIISKDRVDDFSRLKINIRNINNSARWLRYTAMNFPANLLAGLEWEITRCFGYLVNLYYLKANDFCFPSQKELHYFVNEKSIKHRLANLFMDYSTKDRAHEVQFFIQCYYDDRRKKRSVLVSEYPPLSNGCPTQT